MVCEYGMSDRLGMVRLGRRHGNPFLGRDLMEDRDYSEDVARAISVLADERLYWMTGNVIGVDGGEELSA